MKERTLIPLDGSKEGEGALHYMEDLIEKLKPAEVPEVILLRVISPHEEHINVEGGYVDIIDESEDLVKARAEAAEYLEKAAGTLRSKGVAVNNRVVVNDTPRHPFESILEVEEEVHADLVAISTHRVSPLTKWIHENTAEKVARKGRIPVLLVRTDLN
jgi:nucleotide-binding universal stress UspA family protein